MENSDKSQPKVTFGICSYNQEAYISDALDSAFSQDFPNLQIIVSDDCSQDQTFAIIQKKVNAYSGPHEVIARQNPENLGISEHINTLMECSNGEIIILAGGDDISHPERTVRTAQTFQNPLVQLVHSSVVIIDEASNRVPNLEVTPLFTKNYKLSEVATSMSLYVGATGAVRRTLFQKYGPIAYKSAFEDLVYGFRAALEGRCEFIDEPLVRYRIGGVSNSLGKLEKPEAVFERVKKSTVTHVDVLRQRALDLKKCRHSGSVSLMLRIHLRLLRAYLKKAVYQHLPYRILRHWAK